jgi:hypothetical protein
MSMISSIMPEAGAAGAAGEVMGSVIGSSNRQKKKASL